MDEAFTKMLDAFPTSYESPQMRPLWLSAWSDFSPAVIVRTVDIVIRNFVTCPSLDEFLEEAHAESVKVNKAYMRERMVECTSATWVLWKPSQIFFRPCESCLPDGHERWSRGSYEPTQ